MVKVEEIKFGSLDALRITNVDAKSSMCVTLFGANIYSFITGNGQERLFCSSKCVMDGTKPLRGGIPVVFPQFGGGKLPNHGFARTSIWKFEGYEKEGEKVKFGMLLVEDEHMLKMWNHPFVLKLEVEFDATAFSTQLIVTNSGPNEFRFQALLHNYYLLPDVKKISILGLDETKYIDKLKDYGDMVHVQHGDLAIDKETDSIYKKAAKKSNISVLIGNGTNHRIDIEIFLKQNNEIMPVDAVVWNPWIAKSKAMSDFGDEEYLQMLCVEPGCVSRYETCFPEESWVLFQKVTFS